MSANPEKVFPACPECKGPVTSSTALDGCYDCHKEDSEHVYMCSAACLKRSLCRTGSCEHWSLYDCKEALGIQPKASPAAIAADRAEKYRRRDDYEESKAQRKNATKS